MASWSICHCGTATKIANRKTNYPAVFDEASGVYWLISGQGEKLEPIYYCFYCGGLLFPNKWNPGEYMEINPTELKKVKEFLPGIKNTLDMEKVFGTPDEVFGSIPKNPGESLYRYWKRFRTMELFVTKRRSGSLGFSFKPKWKRKSFFECLILRVLGWFRK